MAGINPVLKDPDIPIENIIKKIIDRLETLAL